MGVLVLVTLFLLIRFCSGSCDDAFHGTVILHAIFSSSLHKIIAYKKCFVFCNDLIMMLLYIVLRDKKELIQKMECYGSNYYRIACRNAQISSVV